MYFFENFPGMNKAASIDIAIDTKKIANDVKVEEIITLPDWEVGETPEDAKKKKPIHKMLKKLKK